MFVFEVHVCQFLLCEVVERERYMRVFLNMQFGSCYDA
jgi:hypothetical protein